MSPDRNEDEDEDDRDERGLRAYPIDKDSVRVNNPDPDQPDTIVRRLASGEVKEYKVRKRKE